MDDLVLIKYFNCYGLILTILYTVVNIAVGFVENIWIINSNGDFEPVDECKEIE